MKIPIKYNPLGNGYDGAGGAVYGSTGCFLFRGSYCIQSGMQLDGKTIRNATRQPSRMEMFASGSTSDTTILGGTMYVNGGVATKTDVYTGGTMYVRSSGTASNVKIQSGCDVLVSGGGVIYGADLYHYSATITASNGGTLVSTTMGGEKCVLICNSAVVSGLTVTMPQNTVYVNGGTGADMTINGSTVNVSVASGHLSNVNALNGIVSFTSSGSADGIALHSGATLNVNGTFSGTNINIDGGKFNLWEQGQDTIHVQGTCPYGLFNVGNNQVSGGLYQGLYVSNGVSATGVNMNNNGIMNGINNVKVSGLQYYSSGSMYGNAYTTFGAVTLREGGYNATISARSTLSNVRFINSGNASLNAIGDGAFLDISTGSNVTVNITGGNACLIRDLSLSSGNVSALQFGAVSNVQISRGAVYLAPFSTAGNVHVGAGTITIAGATVSDVSLTSNGAMVYQSGSLVDFGVMAGASLCDIRFNNGCKIVNGTFTGWRRLYLDRGATMTSATLNGVPMDMTSSCHVKDCVISGDGSGAVHLNGASGGVDGLTVSDYHLTCGGNYFSVSNLTHNATGNNATFNSIYSGVNWTLNALSGSINNCICTSVSYVGGSYYCPNCSMSGVDISSGATVRFYRGTHSIINISSGAVFELSSGTATTVHVMSGGSLACVNNGAVYACTSDAGAIVTGSNIHYVG